MLPNVEARTLPAIGELANEMLGLDGERLATFEAAQTLSLPVWKRTNLGDFDLKQLRPVFGYAEIETFATGVYVADLQTALVERPELLDQYANQAVEARFNAYTAYNAALGRDGVVVHVPRNVEVEAPIRVRYRLPEGGTVIFPRTLVIAEENSRVTVIEEFVSDDLESVGLVVPVAEIISKPGARVQFMSLQTLGKGAYLFGAQAAQVSQDAGVEWLSGAIGASIHHMDMDVRLIGNGSELQWSGFSYGTKQQQLLWAPRVHHIGQSTTSQITWKSAVADTAYVVFDGMINIERGAKFTNSDLRDNVLHLSDKARSDSIPGLEIDSNEVKAGHGATSGQVDEEQVFYLRSRGLTQAEAVRTIVIGFLASIVEKIPLDDVRDHALELIENKM
jgi:Fe-S cluster assembly protein SufD